MGTARFIAPPTPHRNALSLKWVFALFFKFQSEEITGRSDATEVNSGELTFKQISANKDRREGKVRVKLQYFS